MQPLFLILFLILSGFFLPSMANAADRPIAKANGGQVVGRWQTSRGGRKFASFEGLPYAKPPKRFKASEPIEEWKAEEIYNGTYPRDFCPQLEDLTRIYYDSTEDCLFLNVFIPENIFAGNVAPVPVMFWIHGGGYTYGAGSVMGPKYILDEDVVLVTINYRLGALGFLNSGADGLVRGNMGFKDMIHALRWVQKNVHNFGGDPVQVTICGESAGGAAVHSLMLSPAATGLFHKVIAQSGTAFAVWNSNPKPELLFDDFAHRLNCYEESPTETLYCLEQKPLLDILQAQGNYTFGSTVDKNPPAEDYSVFPEKFQDLLRRDDVSRNLPLIIGHNQREGLIMAIVALNNDEQLAGLNSNWSTVLPQALGLTPHLTSEESAIQISEAIRKHYFNGVTTIDYNQDCINRLERLISDLYFVSNTRQAAILSARQGAKVYPYKFEYLGNFSLATLLANTTTNQPIHADDLQYLFQSLLEPIKNWPDLSIGSRDETFSRNLIRLWVSFAYDGIPSNLRMGATWDHLVLPAGKEDEFAIPMQWYIFDDADQATMRLESKEEMKRVQFWNELFSKSSACMMTATSFLLLGICPKILFY